jgi:hypothetical protein
MDQKVPKLSVSPKRNTFQSDGYIQRQLEEGKSLDDPEVKAMIEWYDSWSTESAKREADPKWQENNLEYDLRSTEWIVDKVRASESYAQNLYAAMCNNDFQRIDVWPVLKNEIWYCSWRSAGGIVANMRGEGDYIDWYCSGIKGGTDNDELSKMTQEQRNRYQWLQDNFVGESVVTDEIREDLKRLGWSVITNSDESY